MYIKPDKITLCNLLENAERLAESGGGEPRELLDIVMKLQFFPAQFSLCQKLVKLAYAKLKRDNNADFETYRLFCNAAIKFLTKDPKNGKSEEVEFAFRKMWETKREGKHMRIIFETWCEIKKFSWLAKKVVPNMIEKV